MQDDTHNARMDYQEKNGGPNYVQEWRKHRRLTQQQLADKVDTSKGNMSDLENGKRSMSLDWLNRISEALAVPTPLLIGYPPERAPDNLLDALETEAAPQEPLQPYEPPSEEALLALLAFALDADIEDHVAEERLRTASDIVRHGLELLVEEPGFGQNPRLLIAALKKLGGKGIDGTPPSPAT